MYEIIIAILIGLDQIIKYWALNFLKEVNSIPVINNIFSLTYVENRGAAFGMLQNNQSIFILVAAVASCFGLYYLHSKKVNNLGKIGILLVISGAIGNLIDRIFRGSIVDFIGIGNFPIFNLADAFLVIGWFLLIISVLIIFNRDMKLLKNDKK